MNKQTLAQYNEFLSKNINSLFLKKNSKSTKGVPSHSVLLDQLLNSLYLNPELSDENSSFLKNLIKTQNELKNHLSLLDKLNVSYAIHLVGGSIRDAILNKSDFIKDFDFFINIENFDQKNIAHLLSKNELDSVSWDINSKHTKLHKTKLLQLSINQHTNDCEHICFEDAITHVTPYRADERITKEPMLISVSKLKINDIECDILLSDLNIDSFIEKFDFDICKCSINLTDINKNPTPIEILNNTYTSLDFWTDIIYKKISYNISNKSQTQMENSFANHFKRIKSKYPECNAFITGENHELNEQAEKLALKSDVSFFAVPDQKEDPLLFNRFKL